MRSKKITVTVNDRVHSVPTESRTLLSDFLRHTLRLTGTHVGCEQGACGSCTVLVDGEPVRSCLMLAVQVDGRRLETVEGLADNGELTGLQQAVRMTPPTVVEEHLTAVGLTATSIDDDLATLRTFVRQGLAWTLQQSGKVMASANRQTRALIHHARTLGSTLR